MTRDEFIAGYVERSGGKLTATDDGFVFPNGWKRLALPCNCGASICDGWAMVSNDPEMVADHMLRFAPDEKEMRR